MHMFRRAMPLWRVQSSASVAGGLVGALHTVSRPWSCRCRTCEDGLHLDQLSLVVLHVLDELADGVVGAVDFVVLGGVPMDYSKSKKHEGVAVFLAIAGNTLKKIIIVVFENFTHQLVLVLIDEIVTVAHNRDLIGSTNPSPPSNKSLVRTSGASPSHPTNELPRSEGEQADDFSTGSTPTGNVDESFAFIVSLW